MGHYGFNNDDRRRTFHGLDSLQQMAIRSLGPNHNNSSLNSARSDISTYKFGQKRHTFHYPHKINQTMVKISQTVSRQNRRPSISSQIEDSIKLFDQRRLSRKTNLIEKTKF